MDSFDYGVTCGVIGFFAPSKLSMVADAISHSVLLGIVWHFYHERYQLPLAYCQRRFLAY